jgi:AbiV family abortive infection protein
VTIGLKPWPLLYRGRLTPAQMAEGISVSNYNAARLLEDATLLAKNERYPSAVALAILAIEESAKAGVLRAMAMCRNETEMKSHWRQFRNHSAKNIMSFAPLLDQKQALAKNLDSLSAMTSDTRAVEDLKQTATYTDCIQLPDHIEWWIPEVVDKRTADVWLTLARLVVKAETVTTEEVELWIRLMKPLAGGLPDAQQAAIETYLTEVRKLRQK